MLGESIELDGDCDMWPVRGHVPDADAADYASAWHREYDLPEPSHYVVRQQWARWSMETIDGEPRMCFREYWESGPGRFPVTIAYDGDEWDRRAALREHRRSELERARAWAAAHYPDAEARICPQVPGDPVRIHLRVTGLPHDAVVALPPGHRGTSGLTWQVPSGAVDQWRSYIEGQPSGPTTMADG